jgi:hypothetical protein
MNEEITQYIQKSQPWQRDVCQSLHKTILHVIPDVEGRLQYGKPHYLKHGHYAAVIHVGKGKVSFMVFNAIDVPEVKGMLRSMGNGERKVVDIAEGQTVDYEALAGILRQTSSAL